MTKIGAYETRNPRGFGAPAAKGEAVGVAPRRERHVGALPSFIYLEIGPLRELEFTGVARVTAALAEQMLDDCDIEPFFFVGRTMVDNATVAGLLEDQTGELLDWHIGRSLGRPAPLSCRARHVGVFPNIKTCRRVFDFEAQIIHDLSPLLMPQYHCPSTVADHALSVADDVASNDLTICVSEATRTDVLRYLGPLDPNDVITVHNAASPIASPRPAEASVKPHILVLGTIEPRKNAGEVLSLLRDCPSLAGQFDFVFLGRHGWGDTIERLVEDYDLAALVEDGSLLFQGYVAEAEKNQLMQTATMLIYPSLFEGFGLPVVEAMSLGVPCLTTRSSSLPEVGGDACFYFDPFAPGDFRRALISVLVDIRDEGEAVRERCRAQASTFSWQRSYRRLMDEIATRASRSHA